MEGAQYQAQPGTQLEYSVAERTQTDWITDPGMAILLSIITCGIYGWYIVYKLVQRRDEHFRRMAAVADSSISQLRIKARGREDVIAGELSQLEQVRMQMTTMSAERGAAIWLLIAIFTFGIGYMILYYLLMQDYVQHDAVEARFFTLMSSAMAKVGLAGEAGQAVPAVPQREFVTFLLLTIVTCGIYGIYWMYVMIKDFNEHFVAQVPWEDFLLQALR
ncbi:MAG: DUF4234 domain-containing protein [Actinobacteria bacterium]|nr:DUF4234 domain-containing protein [Actinomycetota bacterium]